MDNPDSGDSSVNGVAINPPPVSLPEAQPQTFSKSARKKQLKQQRLEQRKAERKSLEKERKRRDLERKRREWDEKLASVSEEERVRLLESRKENRRERMEKRAEEREMRVSRLRNAAEVGQKIVLDLEFGDVMAGNEIHSLVQQIMYCYAVNGRCMSPAHLWLTGCKGEIATKLQRLPGYDKWIIEKQSKSYIDVLQDQKENLVYLTADADVVLDELDPKHIYIVGGLVDRNRWKGITMKRAQEHGIQSARLPIGSYLKMSSSQVLTVNQVVEILLKFQETRDWKTAFHQVVPQRKRGDCEVEDVEEMEAAAELDTVVKEFVVAEDVDEKEESENENGDDEEEEQRDSKKTKIEETNVA